MAPAILWAGIDDPVGVSPEIDKGGAMFGGLAAL